MRVLLLIFTLIFFSGTNTTAQSRENRGVIKIKVTGFRNTDGQLMISLFNKEDGYPSENPFLVRKLEISSDTLENEFMEMPYGDYAIAIVHDESNNGELDSNMFGIPKEGVGASNDATRTFGPPRFKDARFQLNSDEIIVTIKLRYY